LTHKKPSVLIQGSATGIYGTTVDEPAGENHPAGKGFLADLTKQWEEAVMRNDEHFPRLVLIRTGLVLGMNAGLMKRLVMPFRFYTGTVLGSGEQWLAWIHIKDQVRAIRYLLENSSSSGPYNLTAPEPEKMKTFIQTMGKILHKPAWLHLPPALLRAALGELADETILSSQNIIPSKLISEGFEFRFPGLQQALNDLLIKH
jgi:uncharacterized protein (TIGR01777 family)